MFEAMENEYMRARAADIADIGQRVLSHLTSTPRTDLSHFDEDVVLLADDLSPSEFALMDMNRIKGFVTEKGGRTSHVAIMARTLGVPAVVGANDITTHVAEQSLVVLDGDTGDVFIDPDQTVLSRFEKQKREFEKTR